MIDKNCVFCKIISGEIPSAKVYEDDKMLVFKDIEPKAKVHLLAIAKDHFKLLEEADPVRAELISYILNKIPQIAKDNGCQNGYRLVINQGEDAGQTVFHLHVQHGGKRRPGAPALFYRVRTDRRASPTARAGMIRFAASRTVFPAGRRRRSAFCLRFAQNGAGAHRAERTTEYARQSGRHAKTHAATGRTDRIRRRRALFASATANGGRRL